MELRRRRDNGGDDDDDDDQQNSGGGIARFGRIAAKAGRAFDMFPKAKEDYRRRQNALGGAVSTFAVSVIALLILVDFLDYAFGWSAYRTELSVDRGISAAVPFELDISFFGTPCHELSLDAVDASGQEVPGMEHDLIKTPVDHAERLVVNGAHRMMDRRRLQEEEDKKKDRAGAGAGGASVKIQSQYHAHHHRHTLPDGTYCGPCFAEPLDADGSPLQTALEPAYEALRRHLEEGDAPLFKRPCCNTCKAVMETYEKHKFPRPDEKWAEQCVLEMSHKYPGCNVRGIVFMRKVQGAFFFAPGKGFNIGGQTGAHVHTFSIEQLLRFNASHEIRRFRVGDPAIERFYGRSNYVLFPLEGRRVITPRGAQGAVKYRLQIVPTAYRVGSPTSGDASYASMGGRGGGSLASETEVDESEVSYEYQASIWHKMTMPGIFAMFGGGETPSVLFRYDFFSMQVTHVFDRPPFSVFLVRACTLIGGLFVVLGLVDRAAQFLAREVEWERILGPRAALALAEWLRSDSGMLF